MKVCILCGGFGTRLSEETVVKPKPMVEIGGKPILWHIMKSYDLHGFSDFVLALGYKGDYIKDYFLNYHARQSDLNVTLKNGEVTYKNMSAEDWSVSLIDTGSLSMTGGRLLRLKDSVGSETFMLTYGDGVSNVDIKKLLSFHREHGRIATITAVRPPARFGDLVIGSDYTVSSFKEKPQAGEGWINGGFFVFEPEIFDYIENDLTILEKEPLEQLARDNELVAFKHDGYWQSMDTLRDKHTLESIFSEGNPPWLERSEIEN